MSTGINSQRNSGKMQPCWTDAFFLLDDNRHTRQQMSQLDRGREKQIRRLRRGLLKVRGMPREEEKEPSLDDKDARKMYFGPPYSYRACLHKDARQDIRLRKEDGGYGDEF